MSLPIRERDARANYSDPPLRWALGDAYLAILFYGSLSPTIWAIGGPLRAIELARLTSDEESAGKALVGGDGGASVGLFQFNRANIVAYAPSWPDDVGDWRVVPWWQGRAFVAYLVDGIWKEPTTYGWRIAAPWVGEATIRRMWTHGLSGGASMVRSGDYSEAARIGPAGMWAAVIVGAMAATAWSLSERIDPAKSTGYAIMHYGLRALAAFWALSVAVGVAWWARR